MSKIDAQLEKLIELNDELENYFRNTIIPQLFIDADLILRKFTPPAMKQFSLSISDLGKSITDVKEHFRFPSIIENIQYVITNNEILEKEIQTTDFRWYQMNIIPYVIAKTNQPNGVIITFVEITMRIKDLKEQEKLIYDYEILLDSLSHDFKTPLTSLALSIDRLKNLSPENSQQSKQLLNIIESGVKKMRNIITELTDSRKDEHKFKTEEELLNFGHILEDVRLTITANILESSAIIKSELEVSEIVFSRRKLRSIIYNLVINSIKFRSPNRPPYILIKTAMVGDMIRISIKDNGTGINPAMKEKIFSKYFRAENSIEGSGIGLYLVKEMVTSSGGRIELESKPGEGSEFVIFLKAV
ncbi:sensor histidine kinase [Daejeonella oryzae]|uniref:sensor histidine kinase n=1 Tax=Daejeonella oryzae TaxID=1122943 RepID=UPI00041C0E29|nr:ATP-binding protein [Daejeonella oryzae]